MSVNSRPEVKDVSRMTGLDNFEYRRRHEERWQEILQGQAIWGGGSKTYRPRERSLLPVHVEPLFPLDIIVFLRCILTVEYDSALCRVDSSVHVLSEGGAF